MKSLDYQQLKSYVQWLSQTLADARFQDIWTDGQKIVFELYKHRNVWLVVDLHPQEPHLIFLTEKPTLAKKPKPLTLFLQSNAQNLYVHELTVNDENGRVVFFKLASKNHSCLIEIRLIPKAVNILAFAEQKKISWFKPKELVTSKVIEEDADFQVVQDDWVKSYAQNWMQSLIAQKQNGSQKTDPAKKIEQEILKKKSTLEKIKTELNKHDEVHYQKLGELLKYSQEIPDELKEFYDDKKSLSENRERAFQKAKDIVRKRKGTEQRAFIIEAEILALNQRILSSDFSEQISVANKILKRAESHARKKILTSGFEVVIGKTGKDNLAILRQARAWDYWFHLRDYPGAHAILFRTKNQIVPDSALKEVAQWIIQESLSKKMNIEGLKFDVILAECRFVRPVKGAQGLVTYQNERQFIFQAK